MPSVISKHQRQRAKKLRAASTPAESRLWQQLRLLKVQGFHFRRQHPVGLFYVDFICLSKKLAIELDGYSHTIASEHERDLIKEKFLSQQGFQLLRFNNEEVYKNMDGIMETIKTALLQ